MKKTVAQEPSEFSVAQARPSEETIDLGPCCSCQKTGPEVRNIICLDRRGPTPGKGWGCFTCHLPQDGAIAVLCDDCFFDLTAEIIYVCIGYPGIDGRMPIAELANEPFEHDLAFHPEELLPEMYSTGGVV